MACHTDKQHTHLHVIFNNTNCIDGRTFETHENRHTTKQDRSFQKLMNITDEICEKHHLSVIEHHELSKGKNHWEWDMTRQGLSWKAKLKYAIDQVIKDSENFEDFLQKCDEYGILAEYNPEYKIDLKFMLAEQKENNPRAKMTRAKTLGWYYETKQIKDRIAMYQGVMIYAPRTKIRQITQKHENKFIQDAIDRGNMKLASIAKNIITEYGIEPEQIHQASLSAYAHSRHLLSELNTQKTEIEDLQTKVNVLKKYRKLKVYGDELKALSGRQEKKYRNEHLYELSQLSDIRDKVLEIYPSGRIPTVESLEQKIKELRENLSAMDVEFRQEDKKARELADAQRTIEEYFRQEQSRNQQKGKRRNDLE